MPETCAGHAWEDAKYVAQSYTQFSDLTRDPWFVAPGAQRNPHLNSWWENAALTLAFTTDVPTRNPQVARYRVVSAWNTFELERFNFLLLRSHFLCGLR